MRTRRFVAIAGCTGLAIALPLLAAERLAVKTGLWENTATISMTGISIPQEQLDKMPPAQRTQMEQMLRQMGVGAPRTHTDKSCITEQDLHENAFRDFEQPGEDCQHKEVTATAKRREWTFQCKSRTGDATGRMVVDVVSDTQVRGTMEMRSPQANMDMKFEAKWLAASCPAGTG